MLRANRLGERHQGMCVSVSRQAGEGKKKKWPKDRLKKGPGSQEQIRRANGQNKVRKRPEKKRYRAGSGGGRVPDGGEERLNGWPCFFSLPCLALPVLSCLGLLVPVTGGVLFRD